MPIVMGLAILAGCNRTGNQSAANGTAPAARSSEPTFALSCSGNEETTSTEAGGQSPSRPSSRRVENKVYIFSPSENAVFFSPEFTELNFCRDARQCAVSFEGNMVVARIRGELTDANTNAVRVRIGEDLRLDRANNSMTWERVTVTQPSQFETRIYTTLTCTPIAVPPAPARRGGGR